LGKGIGNTYWPRRAKGILPKGITNTDTGILGRYWGMIVGESFKGIERNDSQVDFKGIVK